MVASQIINYVLSSKDFSIFTNNNITRDYMFGFESEFDYIKSHLEQYGNIPDTATFLSKFPDFELLDVTETERYMVDTIREEYLYAQSVPVLQKAAELLKTDANSAAQYMLNEIQHLQPNYDTEGIDIVHDLSRKQEFENFQSNKDKLLLTTGFEELDTELGGGWDTKEEFVVFFARTNMGKSWIILKTATHACQIGKNVGFVSPEMSATKLAYRFDTLWKGFSNMALNRGDTNTIPLEEYQNYLNELSGRSNSFVVATPRDFNRDITVGKLRSFVKNHNLDVLLVDGITYLKDERAKRGDNKTTTLTNISEDLMDLTCELGIPIFVVVQSNRNGVKEDDNDTPELTDIRDSDGIAQNATKVISIKQKDGSLIMDVKKNRYGRVGGKLAYVWDIDIGNFEFIPNGLSSSKEVKREEPRERHQAEPNKKRMAF